MMQSASVEEVKIYLNDILAQIELGKDVVITRLGQPIARLSPFRKEPKPIPFEKLAALRASLPKMEVSSVELIRKLRDEEY
jgi:antitoxin (DNA-binding transcriptional repressor) of toxin-antitoxin stability system